MSKKRVLVLTLTLIFILLIGGLITWRKKSSNDTFVVIDAISDMLVEQVKEENGNTYILLKTLDQSNTVGIDHFFNESRWVKVADQYDVNAINTDKAYSSIAVQFVIPKDVAIENEWISSDTISIDMFMKDKAYSPDYLWIVDMQE